MKDYFCKCNNCDRILIDENPATNAKKIEVTDGKYYSMEFIQESPYEGGFWACPHCKTDAYLTDNIE